MSNTPGPWGYTPGPWSYRGNLSSWAHVVSARNDRFIAQLVWDAPEAEANARLIAAAPELLNALKAAKDALVSYQYGNSSPDLAQEIVEHAVAVIAKAEGPS